MLTGINIESLWEFLSAKLSETQLETAQDITLEIGL
jgi:hypothetical protein